MRKPKQIRAYVWSKGRIDFGTRVPKGAIAIAKGPERRLRRIIMAIARWSYPSKPGAGDEVPLVPGIPEARNDTARLDALFKFCQQVKERLQH